MKSKAMAETETLIKDEDTSSSDSEEEEESKDNVEIEGLESALAANPCDYDSHVQYIKRLRKVGDIDKLRKARQSMSELFPLTPSMWQQWTKDEASLTSDGDDAGYALVTELYERGVQDYLSVPLWCDYLNFVQHHHPLVRQASPAAISTIRDLYERAVPAAGLHLTQGATIWDTYINFEQTILNAIQDSHTEQKEKQAQRVRSIFHRQLSIPLHDSRSTLLAYKSWEAEQRGIPTSNSNDFNDIPSHVSSAYEKAEQMFKERTPYEEQISMQTAPAEKLQSFMNYVKFEQSSGDPARVRILYERAVTEFPVSSDLWLDYTRYMDDVLKVAKGVLDVYSRATRNCTWIGELWVRYLLSLERAHASEEKSSSVFEKSLQCTFSSYEEYLDLFLTRIDGLRRRIHSAGSTGDSLDYSVLRDTFQCATDYLTPYLQNTEGILRLHAYWARLELKHGNDLVILRGVWESLLNTSGSMLEAWKQFIAMEIEMDHIDEARRIYKRCYRRRFTGIGSEDICHSWVRFEREFGTLEDYEHAMMKVKPRLEELQLFMSQQDCGTDVAIVSHKGDPTKKALQKRKMEARPTEESPKPKKQKAAVQNPTRFAKEANQKSTEENNTGRVPKTSHKPTRFAKEASQNSAEEGNTESVQKATAHKPTRFAKEASQKATEETDTGSGEPKAENPETFKDHQITQTPSRETYTDQCTVFISNLSLQVRDETLHEFFSDVGGVTAIRLLRDKFTGKLRGLAYVDFSDEAHLAAALEKNKTLLLGKNISIARSDPKYKKRKEPSGRNSRGHVSGSDTLEGSKAPRSSEEPKVELRGKNTFAVPRTLIRPLGVSKTGPKKAADEDTPKSNDEFRKLFLKK